MKRIGLLECNSSSCCCNYTFTCDESLKYCRGTFIHFSLQPHWRVFKRVLPVTVLPPHLNQIPSRTLQNLNYPHTLKGDEGYHNKAICMYTYLSPRSPCHSEHNSNTVVQRAPNCQSSCVIKGIPQTYGVAPPTEFRLARFRPNHA